MKKNSLIVVCLMILMFVSNSNLAAQSPPVKGDVLPPITLAIPKEAAEKGYLGFSSQGFFKIPQIKARVVIIEIFSLYCPACVKLAPKVKELYQIIESKSDLNGKIKLIGIGAGNTVNEVQNFQRITETPFPLFPDRDFHIHEALGQVRTPYFFVIRINENGTHEVVYSELGGFNEAQEFLDLVITGLGLK